MLILEFNHKDKEVIKSIGDMSKIDNILSDTDIKDFDMDSINNNYICIYQTDGNLEPVYEAIKGNIHKKIGKPWLIGAVDR